MPLPVYIDQRIRLHHFHTYSVFPDVFLCALNSFLPDVRPIFRGTLPVLPDRRRDLWYQYFNDCTTLVS